MGIFLVRLLTIKRYVNMKKLLFIIAIFAVGLLSCDKESIPQSAPKFYPDNERETADGFYTYFAIANNCSKPIQIEFVEVGSDIGTILPVNSATVVADKADYRADRFLELTDKFYTIVAYFDRKDTHDTSYIKMVYTNIGLEDGLQSISNPECWVVEDVDDNSRTLTYTFTDADYNYAKEHGQRSEAK